MDGNFQGILLFAGAGGIFAIKIKPNHSEFVTLS